MTDSSRLVQVARSVTQEGFLEHLRFSFWSQAGTAENGALRKDSSLTFKKAFNIDHSRGGREGAD